VLTLRTHAIDFVCEVCGKPIATEHYVPPRKALEMVEDVCECVCGCEYHIASVWRDGRLSVRWYRVSQVDPINYPHNPVVVRRVTVSVQDEA